MAEGKLKQVALHLTGLLVEAFPENILGISVHFLCCQIQQFLGFQTPSLVMKIIIRLLAFSK